MHLFLSTLFDIYLHTFVKLPNAIFDWVLYKYIIIVMWQVFALSCQFIYI